MEKRQARNPTPSPWAGKKYYIGGKCYEPDRSTLLCRHVIHHPERRDMGHIWGSDEYFDIYATTSGTFFRVSGDPEAGGESVTIIDEAAAIRFMNSYSSVIITDNYDKILGVPENG